MAEVYRGVWVIAYRELLRVVNERSRWVELFVMPLMILVVFGVGFNSMVGSLTPEVDYIKFLFPGVIAMNVIFTSLGAGASIVWDREHGFLKEVLVAPISRSGAVLGKAVGGAAIALGNSIILFLLAPIVGVSLSPMLVLKLIPLLAILSLSLSGLGILLATRMRSQREFGVVMQLLQFPLVFLSGTFFPINNLPVWLGVISKVNPVTYGVDAIRQHILSGDVPAGAGFPGSEGAILGVTIFGHTMGILEDALVVGLLGLALMAAAVWSFNRQE